MHLVDFHIIFQFWMYHSIRIKVCRYFLYAVYIVAGVLYSLVQNELDTF